MKTTVPIRLLAIIGPTAVGKSALALRLADRFGGEIISADSRQVYRYMDVGTAKPSIEDRALVPHHIIDIVNPDEDYNLAIFLPQAKEAIQVVKNHSSLPILVGGTGQYVWGLLEGWQVQAIPPDWNLRKRLEEQARLLGPTSLFQDLSRLAPSVANRIDSRNVRRMIRAFEVLQSESNHQPNAPRKVSPEYQIKLVGLTLNRSVLHQSIDARIESMIKGGWIDEVSWLLTQGYDTNLPSLSSLGYRELVKYLRNELSLVTAIERIKRNTYNFAKRQHTWFKPTDKRICWFDASVDFDKAESNVAQWLNGDDHSR